MKYIFVLLIIFLASCSTNQPNPVNPITEIEQKELSPLEKRKLLLSTPYVLEILPEFPGLAFDVEKVNIGTDLKNCLEAALYYPIEAIPFVQSHIESMKKAAKDARSERISGTGSNIATAGAVAGALALGPYGLFAAAAGALGGAMYGYGMAAPYLLIAEIINDTSDENVSAENSAKAFIIKSITVRCLITQGYVFDIYSALVLADKNNIQNVDYYHAEQFFEIYGDLAVAELATILNDSDPYEIIENDTYYQLSSNEKEDLEDYLYNLKLSNLPLRLINRDVALQALGAADKEPFVYFDPLAKRFIFKL